MSRGGWPAFGLGAFIPPDRRGEASDLPLPPRFG